MSLYDRFMELFSTLEENPGNDRMIAELILNAPEGSERDAMAALIYHEGIGVEMDLDRCFELAEKAAFEGHEPLGYFLLGYMCDNAETPDQAEGGPRQKYDHYDAERFYEICAASESPWKDQAVLWLGDYFMDSARGGDPEIGLDYYKGIADHNPAAAEAYKAALLDYYDPSIEED